jgi:DNA-binding transcriptional LysR family regulator
MPASRDVNLDLDLLRTFVAVADTRNFTRAGQRLGRTQSAVSLQVRRLEQRLGVVLFLRDPRRVALTHEGELMLPQVRSLLRLNDDIVAGVTADEVEGEVRLGAPEDFATVHLPEILGEFARSHRKVTLSVSCDLTLNLLDRLRDGELDLALIKREPMGPDLGVRVWREPLVWAAADAEVAKLEPLPLCLAPTPCIYRKRAVAALQGSGRPFRVAYASPSLAGLHAALRAGLGVSVLPREMAPPDVTVLGPECGLPALPDTEIALMKSSAGTPRAADALADFILASLDRRSRMAEAH